MTAIIHQLVEHYKYLNEDVADPRNRDIFLVGTPWPILTVIGFYLYFVLNIGPRFMEGRQSFKLDRILQIYDIFQIIINIRIFYIAFTLILLDDYNFFCEPIDFSNSPKSLKAINLVWLYFLIKILDLADTIFFVLRKKQNQVSFLHVYHHVGMVLLGWGGMKYLSGGHVSFLGLINSFIHAIMYTHYLLTSMKINTNSWKKYITQLQLLQFFLIGLHFTQLLWVENCDFPIWPTYILVPQNFFMIILFGEFYYKTYIKKTSTTMSDKTMSTKTETNGISTEISSGKLKKQ